MKAGNNKQRYRVGGVVITLLIFFHWLGWLGSAENLLVGLFKPVTVTMNAIRVRVLEKWTGLSADNSQQSCGQNCQVELVSTQAQLSLMTQENQLLKNLLAYKTKTNYSLLVAEVLGKNIDTTEKTIILSLGSGDGVTLGAPVIGENGILVGKVIKVEPALSIARLLSDSQSKIAVTILSKNYSLGVLEGGYGLSWRVKFIPRNEIIMIGETVVTSGLEPSIPRGLMVGNVVAIENESYQPFQQAVVSPLLDLNKLTIVSILQKKIISNF